MATTKLSEALAALQTAASVSGLTVRLVVAGKDATEKAQTITLAQLLTALGVPRVQTDGAGTASNYIYSNYNDKTKGALSGVFKVYQYNGECYLRHKYWGTSESYDDGLYATVKLPYCTTSADGVMQKDMLVRLRNATQTETGTTTAVNITYPNFANGGTKTLTLTAATTAKAGVMTVDQVNALTKATTDISSLNSRVLEANTLATTAQRSANSASLAAKAAQLGVNALTPYTNTLQSYIVGELGSYDNAEDFGSALINMTKATHQNGRYFATVGGVPLFVTFEVLNNADNILCQWVEGAVTVGSDGKIFTNTTQGTRIISRIYADGVWDEWHTSALMSDLPTPQAGLEGYEGKYIFSHQSDNDRKVLSGNFKVISVNTGVEIQHRVWGATAYTNATTKKAQIPIVNPSQYGVMNKDVYKRLIYHTHYESGSTTTEVHINYTNYETGGTNTLTLTAASSAKAGVMTSDHYNKVELLKNWIIDSLGSFDTTTAFRAALNNMPQATTTPGRYMAILNGAHIFVSFALLEASSQTYAQWIEGPIIKGTDGEIYLNNELGVHICGRIYRNGMWGNWKQTLFDDEFLPASTTNDGLMSKEDKQLLEKIKTQLKL